MYDWYTHRISIGCGAVKSPLDLHVELHNTSPPHAHAPGTTKLQGVVCDTSTAGLSHDVVMMNTVMIYNNRTHAKHHARVPL